MKYLKLYEDFNSKFILYHETSKDNYDSIKENGLKIINGERAQGDELVPYGIFLKDNDKSIGFENSIQIKVEANFVNSLILRDRDEIKKYFSEKDSCFKENIELHDATDDKYNYMVDELTDEFVKSPMDRKTKAEKFKTESDALLKQWRKEIDEISTECKKCITDYLLSNGYDSMIILNDVGSWGRKVKTYISLKEDNLKIVE
jgi:hypothetical protein